MNTNTVSDAWKIAKKLLMNKRMEIRIGSTSEKQAGFPRAKHRRTGPRDERLPPPEKGRPN